MMTLNEFVKEFAQYKNKFRINYNTIGIDVNDKYYCPITYLALKKNYGDYKVFEYLYAAQDLQLSKETTKIIITTVDGLKKRAEYSKKLRKQLIPRRFWWQKIYDLF